MDQTNRSVKHFSWLTYTLKLNTAEHQVSIICEFKLPSITKVWVHYLTFQMVGGFNRHLQ